MNRRKLLVAGGAALTTTIAGCSEESSDPDDRETGDTNTTNNNDNSGDSGNGSGNGDGSSGSEEQVKLLEHAWYEESYSSGVKGQLENVSGQTLSYVEVTVYFLDSEGVQIAEGLANTSDLAAERVWEFDAMFLGDDSSRVKNYEIETSVTNY
ncbi:FxLYD domain-containing protein [Haloterrigena salifodinae]|uniref:FxLYD domain-containing protein n=1 Tax=Haloterrigena salifodinae TaxID=2675099 RepID=UPI000F88FE62|nr:FxLYD domain-containing protein [Haloterrigena salifodinae]